MRIRNQIAAGAILTAIVTTLFRTAVSASFGSGPVFIGELPLDSILTPAISGTYFSEKDIMARFARDFYISPEWIRCRKAYAQSKGWLSLIL